MFIKEGKMKILWTGSDVMYLLRYPPFISFGFKLKIFCMRIVVKMILPFVQEHYANSQHLIGELEQFGISNIKPYNSELKHPNKYPKKKHDGINIYYYRPYGKKNPDFIDWLYGYDIIVKLGTRYQQFCWIRLNGLEDMEKVFPIMDFYVRPNRHDGSSRLRRECEINDIPYYWSHESPCFDDICAVIEKLFGDEDEE